MLGTLRLILASLVALQHIGWKPLGFFPGIPAVVMFYLISGYVVSRLWQRMQDQPSPVLSFYRDRLLRIYPAYLFALLVGLAVYLCLEPQSYYLSVKPGIKEVFENLTIVPLNYHMLNDSDRFVFIPPAWSLGAELQFYVLLPLLICFPKSVFAASLLVAALAQAGLIPREWFTYRLLPGVLHVFMAGVLLGSAVDSLQRKKRAIAIWSCYALSLLLLVMLDELMANRGPGLYRIGMLNRAPEVLLGLLLGLPLILWLAPLKSRLWDQRLGDFSYGVFLNHFIVYWAVTSLGFGLVVPVYLAASLILAAMGWYLVETPVKRMRYKLRQR